MPSGCLIPFFLMHYGIFWVVHGVFVFTLPLLSGIAVLIAGGSRRVASLGYGGLSPGAILLATTAMVVSHLASYHYNFIGRREYLAVTPVQQMFQPYSRAWW